MPVDAESEGVGVEDGGEEAGVVLERPEAAVGGLETARRAGRGVGLSDSLGFGGEEGVPGLWREGRGKEGFFFELLGWIVSGQGLLPMRL